MKKLIYLCSIIGALSLALSSCQKDNVDITSSKVPHLPAQLLDYSLDVPSFINVFGNIEPVFIIGSPLNQVNPEITDAGATLGRVLFYDTKLSKNSTVSCSSCHFQERAFTDNKAFSVGFEGAITPRNSMAIINPALNRNLFWDTRSTSALDLTLQPVQNHIEMGMDNINTLVEKISKIDYYTPLFQSAFGETTVTKEKLSLALAQFLCSMTSFDTKFDAGFTQNFSNYTSLESHGKDVFMSSQTNCNACHTAPLFAAQDSPGGPYGGHEVKGTANNGLDMAYADNGRGEGQFKIPSLRNIELTAPYMHDGRFNSLEEVIDHYNDGIQNHPNLDANLKDGQSAKRMNLSSLDKKALIAFLKTLTDNTFINDEKYSNPF